MEPISDSKKLQKQLTHTFLLRGGNFCIRTLFILVLATVLSPHQYGYYALIVASINIGTVFFEWGLVNFLRREIPGSDEEARKQLFSSCFLTQCIILSILALPLIISIYHVPQLSMLKSLDPIDLTLFVALFLISVLVPTLHSYLNATKQIHRLNDALFVENVGQLIVLLFFVFIKPQMGLRAVLVACLVSETASFIASAPGVPLTALTRINKLIIRNAFTYGFPMYLSSLLNVSLRYLDRYFLALLAGASAVGVFHFMNSLVASFDRFSSKNFERVFYPYIFEAHDKQDFPKRNLYITFLIKVHLITFLIFIVLFTLTSYVLFPIFLPKEYYEHALIFPLIGVVSLIVIFTTQGHIALQIQKKTQYIAISSALGLVVSIVCNLLLIPRFAIYGTVMGMIGGFGVRGVAEWYYGQAWKFFDVKFFFSLKKEKEILGQILSKKFSFSRLKNVFDECK